MRITKENGYYKVEYRGFVFYSEALETALGSMRQVLILKGVVAN